jgi:hypothetical protein
MGELVGGFHHGLQKKPGQSDYEIERQQNQDCLHSGIALLI